MYYFKKNKGITLISIVVTIIVILILAGISISMLSGNNGILNQATDAKEKTEDAQIREQIELAILAALSTENVKISDSKLRNELKNMLGTSVREEDITGDETLGWQVKISDKVYAITNSGQVTEVKWIQNSDYSIQSTDGKTSGLKVGDLIEGYNPKTEISSEYSTTISSPYTKNGYGDSDQTFLLGDSYSWKLLGVSNEGNLLITTNDIIGTLTLRGNLGYENGVSELNKICEIFGHGKYALNARSINVDDINKIAHYNPLNSNNGNPYGYGSISEYLNKLTFYWQGNEYPYYENYNIHGNLNQGHNVFYYYENNSWKSVIKSETASTNAKEKIVEVTNTLYGFEPSESQADNLANDMIFTNGNDNIRYWLASTFTLINSNIIGYGLRSVGPNVGGFALARSNGNYERGIGVRPVVILQSNIQLKKVNNIWTIY